MLTDRFRIAAAAAAVAVLPLLVAGCGGAAKGGKKRAAEQLTPAETYRRAEALMRQKKHAKAINLYEKVDTSQTPELRAEVHLRLADAYFERSNILNLAEAQARYLSFLNSFPLSDQAAYAQYRYALCVMRQINKPERDQSATLRAMGEFRKVEELYPNSPWVEEARLRIRELEDHFSQDAMLKARFYFRRKAYRASASRLQELLRGNPDWPQRDEALFFLGVSLRRSGRQAEGDQALQRLLADFPDSKFGRRAAEILESGVGS